MGDANKHVHIFGNPRHNLDPLVRRYGSEEAAFQAIQTAVDGAHANGTLVVDAAGLYRGIVDFDGYLVTVSGKVVGGVARIGTAWVP
jgi:hypothetical protein